jgi:hypothetical protein
MYNIHFTEKRGDLEFRDCKGHINCNPHSQATQLTTIKMRIYQVRYTCYLYFIFFSRSTVQRLEKKLNIICQTCKQ